MVLVDIESAKKTIICILRFFGGGQGRREIIFCRWEQKPLQVLVWKKHIAQYCQHGGIQQEENEFREALRDLIDVNFTIVRVTWLSPAMFLTSAMRSLSDLRKRVSTAKHQSRSSWHKFRWYERYLQNFDWSLGLPGHCRHVFGIGNIVSHEASVATASILPFHGIPTISRVHFTIHLVQYHFAISHFA